MTTKVEDISRVQKTDLVKDAQWIYRMAKWIGGGLGLLTLALTIALNI